MKLFALFRKKVSPVDATRGSRGYLRHQRHGYYMTSKINGALGPDPTMHYQTQANMEEIAENERKAGATVEWAANRKSVGIWRYDNPEDKP